MNLNRTAALGLRAGDVVEVRSEQEILATLDENGAINGLPFMPEMLEHCGKRFSVFKRADKTCDTINYSGSRRMFDTVHLDDLRCNGAAHDGCQARCLFFWNEAWLKPVDGNARMRRRATRGDVGHTAHEPPASTRCTRERLLQVTRNPDPSDRGDTQYRCQATDLLRASSPMRWWDVRQYARDVRSRNVGVMDVVRALLFRGFQQLLKVGGYRALLWSYNRLQSWRGGTPYPFTSGTLDKAPRSTLDLQPGELVRVKTQQEILQTVDKRSRNHGLSFDVEMVRYCGKEFRVLDRVQRIIDERTGRMIKMSRDSIMLAGCFCRAEYSDRRLFCPRSIYSFWREIWLQRVEPR